MANVPPQNSLPTNTIPSNQLPPSYAPPLRNHIGQHGTPPPTQPSYGIKQDFSSNSPQHGFSHYNSGPQTGPTYTNNLGSHSSNSSPAFNKPGMTQPSMPSMNNQASPHHPPLQQQGPKPMSNMASPAQYAPSVSAPSIRPPTSNPGAIPNTSSNINQYPPSSGIANPLSRPIQNQMQPPMRPQPQPWTAQASINPNGPSSQASQAYSAPQRTVNGPSGPINTQTTGAPDGIRTAAYPPNSQYGPPLSATAGMRHPVNPTNTAQISGPPGTHFAGPPTSRPAMGPPAGIMSGPPLTALSANGPQLGPPSGSPLGPPSGPPSAPPIGPTSGQPLGPPSGPAIGPPSGPPVGPPSGPPQRLPSGPPLGPQRGPSLGPPSGPPLGPPSGPPLGPPNASPNTHGGALLGPPGAAPLGPPGGPPPALLPSAVRPPSGLAPGPQNRPPPGHPSGFQQGPPSGPSPGLPSGPTNATYPPSGTQTSMNSRYPQNVPPQGNYSQHQGQHPQQGYQQYNGPQGLTNQMGHMSITQAGFNQMWGQQMFDLLQTRHILPEYPEDPPEIRLGPQFAEATNCSPDIFRCTINRIPETNALLQKSRLPLGILIHPFKDLDHLPVIQCTSIVRCRACRTYINPFVYFVDSKRWKCNLCYRVNDLPEEFQYDPVSKSYGDPTRRPEIKSATIEFIAPGEYMLRPPQPAVYLFLLDVSHIGRESHYLQVFCDTLKSCLDKLPGDGRTQVGFICFDANVHFYLMGEGLTRPREMTVIDIDDVFLPSPESLLVNLGERREMIQDLLDALPRRHSAPGVPSSALGAALQAAFKLMAPTGGRVTVLQTCLPNVGPGSLTSREDPNARSSKEVAHLNPATDFYKRLALECSGAQVAVDLFLVSSQYSDLATLSGISKFSGGSVYHVPVFSAKRAWQADQLRRMLTRYFTRKIGFEAVMRVRCTRGIGIHTFHGNFFVRSTDLLSLPNVSPDSGFGMQLTIEESLSDLQQVCFQAALLYTSSKGERRIRVHTMCLPVASNLTDVLHAADQHCIIGLLTKMAADRAQQSSISDAREALSNVAVDTLSAHRLAQNLPAGGASGSLHAPACLRLLPLYLSALLKHLAFRVGTSTRLDDRVAAMCNMKSLPLSQLMRSVYPELYPVHSLHQYLSQPTQHDDDEVYPDPPRLHLSAERINSNGAYLLDDGELMIMYIGSAVSPAYLADTFGVASFAEVVDEARELPQLETQGNALLHSLVEKLNEDKPYAANILVLRENSPSRKLFTERLVDDRLESAFSYYEFLQHVSSLIK